MKTPSELQVKMVFCGEKITTFSLGFNRTYVLGSSVQLMAPSNSPVTLFSVPLPENKIPVLIFLGTMVKSVDSASFLKIEYRNNTWGAELNEISSFPYEMLVIGNLITVRVGQKLISTHGKRDSYKVSYDTMCKFLIGDISENDLFTEEIFLRRLSGIDNVLMNLFISPINFTTKDVR